METSTEMFWREIASRGIRSVAEGLTDDEAVAMSERFGTHNYHPIPVNIVRGLGAKVWDGAGREYIDCVGAYSALAHGHLNEHIVKAAAEQLSKLTLTSRAFYASEQALFLKALTLYSDMDSVCPMNSGAEAVETCIKIARKWAYTVKCIPRDEAEIIVCDGNFHGRTTTIVGFSSEAAYRDDFGPYGAGFKRIPFGDAAALEEALGPKTAAFLAEPIQAESGVNVPPDGYLEAVRALCDRHGALLIWDEIQTGFCRTGRRFAWMYENAKPDLMAVGKALGGGILPVSAAVGRKGVMDVLRPGDHGSTFGGNPLACAVAVAALAQMETEGYEERAAMLGARLKSGLASLALPEVVDIRGKGLLIGVEFDGSVDSVRLAQAFVANGLLTKETRPYTFRMAPPIVIDVNTIDEIVHLVAKSVAMTRR